MVSEKLFVFSYCFIFLFQIMNNFCPMLGEQIQLGIFKSLRTILDKRVLQ